MLLKFAIKPHFFYIVNNNVSKFIKFGYANKTPFDQHKPISSPFMTPQNKPTWTGSTSTENNLNQPKTNVKVEPQQERITPLTASEEKPVVETEVQPIKEAPPLDFSGFTKQKKHGQQNVLNSLTAEAQPTQPVQPTVQKEVMTDLGLNRYLSRVFTTTGVSLTISLMAAYAGTFIPGIGEGTQLVALSLGLVSYACFSKAIKMDFTTLAETRKGQQIRRTKNSFGRLAVYGLGCISLGLSTSPLFYSINEISQNILPLTMGVSAAMFGGASLLGLFLPRGFMLGYGSVLMGGLSGLIGLNLAGLLAAKFLGVGIFASTLSTVQAYCGIGIFSAMLIYDTHSAIDRYKKGDADHLGMSIQLLLDLMNLIIRIARQIAKQKANQKK